MAMEIEIRVDNVELGKRELESAIDVALERIGVQAENIMVNIIREKDIIDTGRLMGSITHIVDKSGDEVQIGTNVEYAIYQEFGTSRGIVARPFVRPTGANYSDVYRDILEKTLKD